MKVQKMISLDHELGLKLVEEKNYSRLINDLLKAHYGQGKLSKEMIQACIAECEQRMLIDTDKIKRFKEKLKEINKPKSMAERTRFT